VEYVASINRHSRAVNCVRFSPDGSMLASAGDGIIFLCESLMMHRWFNHPLEIKASGG
jgi:WD40 repeat protein